MEDIQKVKVRFMTICEAKMGPTDSTKKITIFFAKMKFKKTKIKYFLLPLIYVG